MIQKFIEWLSEVLKWKQDIPPVQYIPQAPQEAQNAPVSVPITKPNEVPMNQEKLYREAKVCLGYPQKLDPNVPNLLACASSLSGVLKKAGYVGLPSMGIAGTSELNDFLARSADFEVVHDYEPGLIIMAPSNVPGAVLAHGHVGVTGNNGIMSNDSDTGLWREAWTYPKWLAYYTQYGRIPTILYRWKG